MSKTEQSEISMQVQKRDGRLAPFNLEKVTRVLFWAVSDLKQVVLADVLAKANEGFYDGMPTAVVHRILTQAAADLIGAPDDEGRHPNYSLVAGRLEMFRARKEAYGRYTYPKLSVHAQMMVLRGIYDPDLLKPFTEAQLAELDDYIRPERDLNYHYAGSKQLTSKYLIQDRVTGQLYDAPQHAAILIAMAIYPTRYRGERLMQKIKAFYDVVTKDDGSLPTPIWGGVRTPLRQFSSCVVVEAGDGLKEINAAANVASLYGAARAGLGINLGMIRAEGEPVRGGLAYHTGIVPFIQKIEASVKSCSQGGIRGASATLYYPIWHYEFEKLIALKNNRSLERNSARRMDHCFQVNAYLWRRLKHDGQISLFSPNIFGGKMYDAFFADQVVFARYYELAEADPAIRRKTLSAAEVFTTFFVERSETSRNYLQNVDNCNLHSSFEPSIAPIRMSNLCVEITLPTRPLQHVDDPEGEVSLCTLAGVNMGRVDNMAKMRRVVGVLVDFLDTLLDYQDYVVPAAASATRKYRPLGIGVTNYAYWLAKNGFNYSDARGNNATHRWFEMFQYALIEASVGLAKEFAPAPGFYATKYARGGLPIDHYARPVDSVHSQDLLLDWEHLRQQVLRHGMRNCTLSALMPCESSSQVSNSTNGIEPPRELISVKGNASMTITQVVPEYEQLKGFYETAWQMPSNHGYLSKVAIMQKFVDQAISTNTYYDPERYEDGRIPLDELIHDAMWFASLGGKTMYYQNMNDGSKAEETAQAPAQVEVTQPVAEAVIEAEIGCDSGACAL